MPAIFHNPILQETCHSGEEEILVIFNRLCTTLFSNQQDKRYIITKNTQSII